MAVILVQVTGGGFDVGPVGRHPQLFERGLGFVVVALAQQPAGRFGHTGAEGQADEGRDSAQAQDEAPVGAAGRMGGNLEDNQGHDVGQQDADRDHPLLEHAQRPSLFAGGVLSDVGRGNGGVCPDGQADQGAGGQ